MCMRVCFVCLFCHRNRCKKRQNTYTAKIVMINLKPHTVPVKACNHQVKRAGHKKAPHYGFAHGLPYNAQKHGVVCIQVHLQGGG